MRETFAQEKKSLQAEHQLELDRLRHQNQEHLEMLREQQQRDLGKVQTGCCFSLLMSSLIFFVTDQFILCFHF